jgi:hypothetical protein
MRSPAHDTLAYLIVLSSILCAINKIWMRTAGVSHIRRIVFAMYNVILSIRWLIRDFRLDIKIIHLNLIGFFLFNRIANYGIIFSLD